MESTKALRSLLENRIDNPYTAMATDCLALLDDIEREHEEELKQNTPCLEDCVIYKKLNERFIDLYQQAEKATLNYFDHNKATSWEGFEEFNKIMEALRKTVAQWKR